MGEFFSLPPLNVHELAGMIQHFRLEPLSGDAMVWPYLTRLPMGLSWAFWIVQRNHSHQVLRALQMSPDREITGHRPVPSLDGGVPMILACCDNLNIAGTNKAEGARSLELAVAHLDKLGLPVHEIEPPSTSVKSLGYRVDEERELVLPDPRKVALVVGTARWLAGRPRTSGKELEEFVGHFIHIWPCFIDPCCLCLLPAMSSYTRWGSVAPESGRQSRESVGGLPRCCHLSERIFGRAGARR